MKGSPAYEIFKEARRLGTGLSNGRAQDNFSNHASALRFALRVLRVALRALRFAFRALRFALCPVRVPCGQEAQRRRRQHNNISRPT